MTNSYPLIMRAAARTPWAMDPDKMDEIEVFIELKAHGLDVPEEMRAEMQAARHLATRARTSRGVAVIPIFGVISYRANLLNEFSGGTSVQQRTSQFREAVNNPDVATIVFQVASPGGTTDGIPELADEILKARAQKKIIAVADTQSASAAYWLMSAATEIVVTPSGAVGSIGVYGMHFDKSAALEREGVKTTIISAGEGKDLGNETEPLSDEARAEFQSTVDAFQAMFIKSVAKGRGVTENRVRTVFQAKMRLAQEAKAMGMVDRIDTFSNVLARLGVDVGTGQGKRAEDGAPEPQAVIFGTGGGGKIYVLGEWPKRTAISMELLANPGSGFCVSPDGSDVVFTCENGTALYVKDGETLSGDWTCRLVESTYEHQPWPPEQASEPGDDEPAEPARNPRHRRLALLKHA